MVRWATRGRESRKLLVASLGVATINYVATGCEVPETSGNLPAPPPNYNSVSSYGPGPSTGNLSGTTMSSFGPGFVTGNAVPPPSYTSFGSLTSVTNGGTTTGQGGAAGEAGQSGEGGAAASNGAGGEAGR
jgi:hypothetical protein